MNGNTIPDPVGLKPRPIHAGAAPPNPGHRALFSLPKVEQEGDGSHLSPSCFYILFDCSLCLAKIANLTLDLLAFYKLT